MERYCHLLDKTLADHARLDNTLAGMGTTLTVAYSAGPNLFLLLVGDSRAFLFGDVQLFLVTHDLT
ncbi:MAG: serine/threonine protein phosphatase, partial [Bdellovibrionales bacterium]